MNWQEYRMGEIVEVSGGGTPDTTNNSFWEGNILWLTPTEVTNINSRFIEVTRRKITEAGLKNSGARLMPIGSLLLTSRATIGDVAINKVPMATNQGFINIVCNEDFVSNAFLFYWLKAYKDLIIAFANGTTFSEIIKSDFKKIKIKLPPISVQHRIAEILGRYDTLLENYRRQINILETMTKNIYCEWFIRKRCPYATYKARLKIDEKDKLPSGWKVLKVEKCFEIFGGGTPSTKESSYWENGTINWFTPTDITSLKGVFLKESTGKISERGLKNSSAKLFPPYSVMMTSRATIGAVAINTKPATTNQGFITCLPNEKISFAFIYLWIKHNKNIFESLASGVTFLEITKKAFKEIEIVVPPREVLMTFDKAVMPIFSKIENLQSQIDELQQMRDKLLLRLITGQINIVRNGTKTCFKEPVS